MNNEAEMNKNFNNLVSRIRRERKLRSEAVPGFDRKNGNKHAKYLFLLEAPGRKAVKTGEISFDNPDPSARNFKQQLKEARMARKEIAIWNVVLWFLGSRKSIRAAKSKDVRAGIKYLKPLVSRKSMPNLRCIVLVGGAARRAHMDLSRITTARIVTCHHPSGRVRNVRPETMKENIKIFRFLKATT